MSQLPALPPVRVRAARAARTRTDDSGTGLGQDLALLRFGALEGRVLHALWSFDEITLADLHHLMADPALTLPALRSTLEKLHLKRLIRLRKVHRTCFYRAALDRRTFIHLLRAQLADFLGESGMALLHNAADV